MSHCNSLLLRYLSFSFSDDDFLVILSPCRNPSAAGVNDMSYKVHKIFFQNKPFFFKIFQASCKICEIPIQ